MVSRNFNAAELLQMGREPLRVEQHKFAGPQTFHQRDKRNFRGVGYVMKHRFAEERASDADAVKSASEFSLLPCFDRMRVTEFVKASVAFDDLRINPGEIGRASCRERV